MFISVTYVFHTKSKLKWFLLIGWGPPATVVAVTIGITHDDEYNSDLYCWLTFTNGVIYSFIVPVVCIIVVNLIILVIVMKALYSSQLIQTKTEKQKVIAGVRSVSVLLPVLGITWLFGIVSISDDLVVFQYLFALTNSLQGFFIFLFYCVFNVPFRQALARNGKYFDSSRTQSFRTGEENSEVVMKSWNNSQDYSDKLTTDTEFKLPRPNIKLLEGIKPFPSPKRFPSFSKMNNYETSM
ncbi:adhesion G-protein coupled receptor D1-like [Mizuhopecten yessoensis]|uniref:adhesion G-protein coupled receptor D1-like n=1 Tax=Mizuhopecten yessoensis TaxID=6573 RepID=UPI000B45B930|nr:adhesion G-protein coupled receptor D1-like [Mizuhopecten yessoensis]